MGAFETERYYSKPFEDAFKSAASDETAKLNSEPFRAADSSLTERIIAVISAIPAGKLCTYGLVALLAGNPRAARQVVRVLHSFSSKLGLPWQRVVNREGRLSLDEARGGNYQRELLEAEGIEFNQNGTIDLTRFLWRG